MSAAASQSHTGQPLLSTGAPLEDAAGAVIMLHGRGASAEDILGLTAYLNSEQLAYLAPQAAGYTWYPYSFLNPLDDNEPELSAALGVIDALMAELTGTYGIPAERIALLGFSQGACLATEYAARHPRRYGAVIGFSGGVIGPPEHEFAYTGDLEGTPVFLGCSDVDPHIPLARVKQTAALLARLGAMVDQRIYPGMAHTIIPDEIDAAQALLDTLPPA